MKENNTNSSVEYLEEQANGLLDLAISLGLNGNYLFNTTFNRYLMQLELLKKLHNDFIKSDSIVNKEYVKGRENITAHPLITKINQTIDSANKTASLLFKLISNANSIQQAPRELTAAELEKAKDDIEKLNDLDFGRKYGITKAQAEDMLFEFSL